MNIGITCVNALEVGIMCVNAPEVVGIMSVNAPFVSRVGVESTYWVSSLTGAFINTNVVVGF